MTDFTLTIPMEPIGKGRPRMTRRGVAFTPAETRHAEAEMKWWLLKAIEGRETPVFKGPLRVTVTFVFRRKDSVRRLHHTIKPDIDNCIKAMDAFNGLLWEDDAQIVEISAAKVYGDQGAIELAVTQVCDVTDNRMPAKPRRSKSTRSPGIAVAPDLE
jgi:Holliday junction resolvase RusA-like endonuclease